MVNDIEVFYVPVKKIEEILPEVFETIVEKFKSFVEDPVNITNVKDYFNWRKYGTVEIILDGDKLSYTPVWPKKKYSADDLPWAYDDISDIDQIVLEEIKKY